MSRISSGGYSGITNVHSADLKHIHRIDRMETFWIAETLKYFLLLQAPQELLDLRTHVLTTEAHVLPTTSTMAQCEYQIV